jgi:hypothetical protein
MLAVCQIQPSTTWTTTQIREPERIASFVLGACRQTVIDWRRGESRRERLLKAYGVELVAVSGAEERVLGQYVFNHSPHRR